MKILIQKEILRDKIYDVLKGWILDGTLQPGERIVELTVARDLNVSRAPLREALWLLANEGLVDIRAHQGATVTKLSEKSIRDIFEVRETLEIQAAKKIRANLNSQTETRLQNALAVLEKAARKKDMHAFTTGDFNFHKTIWELSNNSCLQEVLERVSTRLFGYALIKDLPNTEKFRFGDVVEEHRRMVQLILKGSDLEIERGFKAAFAEFLRYILARFKIKNANALPKEQGAAE
jgi:DNA-binding GntR family transcriptional regulator